MITLEKKEFRLEQLKRLKEFSAQTKAESIELAAKLFETEAWQNAQTIGTTVSSPIEVDTALIMQVAQQQGKKVYLPKTMPERQMAFLPFTGTADLVTSSFGIPEPQYSADWVEHNLDLILVPGIGFATDSTYRIGFGGGYYDRYLAKFTGKTIALVPTAMKFATAQWPIEPYDIKIQQLITL